MIGGGGTYLVEGSDGLRDKYFSLAGTSLNTINSSLPERIRDLSAIQNDT